ncbi:hypothetical protein Trco_005268 [Trichoderma cornu-damae]|uniref:Uncharacterized protein n=1 Tax=Trichoderma cornu-damae TaxID=654480 RepID=A0A9P8QIN4_9HYPO|nr:hypothetical protein Trco_005268 [Trichoderma cornu-damae]
MGSHALHVFSYMSSQDITSVTGERAKPRVKCRIARTHGPCFDKLQLGCATHLKFKRACAKCGEIQSPKQMGLSRQRVGIAAPHWPIFHNHPVLGRQRSHVWPTTLSVFYYMSTS